VFAPAAIAEIEPLVHEQVAKLIHILETRSGQMSDVMELFRIFALDVVGMGPHSSLFPKYCICAVTNGISA
jgi:hypothetical protein